MSLVTLSARAAKDKDATRDQLSELAGVIYEAKTGGEFEDEAEQEIFDRCLEILSSAYYA